MEENRVSVGSRIREIMSERNLRAVDLHELIKPFCKKFGINISKSQLSQYINDFNEPGQRRLFILAQALDVNEAWLLGFDVDRERKSPASTAGERMKEFAALFSKLTEDQQVMILQAMKGIAEGK